MTDRNDILREISEYIGSESSDELAEAMLDELQERGGIDFDEDDGFFFVRTEDDDPAYREIIGWNDALEAALVQVEE